MRNVAVIIFNLSNFGNCKSLKSLHLHSLSRWGLNLLPWIDGKAEKEKIQIIRNHGNQIMNNNYYLILKIPFAHNRIFMNTPKHVSISFTKNLISENFNMSKNNIYFCQTCCSTHYFNSCVRN
jgi:hypothetical protein